MDFDPDPPSEEIVIFDDNVEWTSQYGAYYAFITITQPLSVSTDLLKLTVDNITYDSTVSGNNFLFINNEETTVGMLSPDYEGATTCSLAMAQLPVNNHVLITCNEIEPAPDPT